MPGASIIETMLFGDIFSFTNKDLYLLAVLDIIILILLFKFLRHIVLISLNTDLARVQKISVNIIELSILLILAIVVTVTVKTIGALLITALLVIPAATARMISTTPINMIIYSIIIALLSGMFGVYISFQLDWPLASAVALASVALYSATACVKFTKQQRQI